MTNINKYPNERAAALKTASDIRPFGSLAEKFAFADRLYKMKNQPPLGNVRGLKTSLLYPVTTSI